MRFDFYSDISKFATGGALYQIQNGQPRLIAHASKRMPTVPQKHSVTEIELCGLAFNITIFSHLLRGADFEIMVDHFTLNCITKSKSELVNNRIIKVI